MVRQAVCQAAPAQEELAVQPGRRTGWPQAGNCQGSAVKVGRGPGRQGPPEAQGIGSLRGGGCTKLGPEGVGNRYRAWQGVGKTVPAAFIPEVLFSILFAQILVALVTSCSTPTLAAEILRTFELSFLSS